MIAAVVATGENGGVLKLLKTHFGYDAFLPLQEDIVGAVMAGRDAFVLMPTGEGKSLCYWQNSPVFSRSFLNPHGC